MSNNPKILEKLPPKTNGKKLLMTINNAQNIYNNFAGSSIEDYYSFMEQNDDFIQEYKGIIENEEEEINNNKNNGENVDEISKEMLSDVDVMLKEIQELKSRINDFKIKNKIKTKRDYLKYMNLIDNQNNDENNNSEKKGMNKSQNIFYNNKLEKSFKKKSEEEKLSEYKKYIIPKENQKDQNYKDIKEKLQKQEELIKKFENIEISIPKENDKNNKKEIEDNINGDEIADIGINKYTGDNDVDKLLNEIKLADMKMDSYLKDIDECLEMNENIEKQLDNNEEINTENNINEKNSEN